MTPAERDLIVRTVLGEAADQPPEGQAAVAHVIMNRLKSGKFGDNLKRVILQPNAFEPWSTRAGELVSIPRNGEPYRAVAQLVAAVEKGDVPDPTKGATYFMNEDIVKKRNAGRVPQAWAQGPGLKIGDHTFFKPEAKTETPDYLSIFEKHVSEPKKTETQPSATAETVSAPVDYLSLFEKQAKGPAKTEAAAIADKLSNANSNTAMPAFKTSLVDQIAEGMPIVGPLLNKATAAATAAAEPAINPIRAMLGMPQAKNEAFSFGERYSKNLDQIESSIRKYGEENPVKSTVANLIGGGMALGPVAGTQAGRVAMGITGPTLGSRIIQGTTFGTLLGGTDAALRGESPDVGATVGGIVGGAAPLVATGVRGATNFVANNFWPRQGVLKDISNINVNRLMAALEGETPASLQAGRETAGPAGMLGDIAPQLTDLAGGLADTPGMHKAVVREAYRVRNLDRPARIEAALTDATGQARTNIESYKNFLTETRAAAADPLYAQWRMTQVHPTDELKELIPRLEKAGAFNMAEELSGIAGKPINKSFFTTGKTKDFPTTESWDYVKRGLDRSIDKAFSSGDKTLGRELSKLRNEMVVEIEKTNAGSVWKQARKEFAERSSIIDQIEAGRDTFNGGRSGFSVDELKEELKGLSGPELAARITGMRNAVDEAMGASIRGDTTIMNKLLAPNNQEKMKLLVGDKNANKLIKTLEQEKFLIGQDTNVRLGTQTTPKKERINALKPQPFPRYDPDFTRPLSLIPPQIRESFRPTNIIDAWRSSQHSNADRQLADLLTIREGQRLQNLIDAMAKESTRRARIAGKSDKAANSILGLVAVPGSTTARKYSK